MPNFQVTAIAVVNLPGEKITRDVRRRGGIVVKEDYVPIKTYMPGDSIVVDADRLAELKSLKAIDPREIREVESESPIAARAPRKGSKRARSKEELEAQSEAEVDSDADAETGSEMV